jgi:hypothetical protein
MLLSDDPLGDPALCSSRYGAFWALTQERRHVSAVSLAAAIFDARRFLVAIAIESQETQSCDEAFREFRIFLSGQKSR